MKMNNSSNMQYYSNQMQQQQQQQQLSQMNNYQQVTMQPPPQQQQQLGSNYTLNNGTPYSTNQIPSQQINYQQYKPNSQISVQQQQPQWNQIPNQQYQNMTQISNQQQYIQSPIQQQPPKQIIKMNQFVVNKPSTPPPTIQQQNISQNPNVIPNQVNMNSQVITMKPIMNQQQQQQQPTQQMQYSSPNQQIQYNPNNIAYVNKPITVVSVSSQPQQQQYVYNTQQSQQQQPQQTTSQPIQTNYNITQTNQQQQPPSYYSQQITNSSLSNGYPQNTPPQQQQQYNNYTQQQSQQINNQFYTSPAPTNRIVYINGNITNTNSNATPIQQAIPINTYQSNTPQQYAQQQSNLCIIQQQPKPEQQTVYNIQQQQQQQAVLITNQQYQTPVKTVQSPIVANQSSPIMTPNMNKQVLISNQPQTGQVIQVTLNPMTQQNQYQQQIQPQQATLIAVQPVQQSIQQIPPQVQQQQPVVLQPIKLQPQLEPKKSEPIIAAKLDETNNKQDTKLSASVHANIEATIDDMMKQYKMESKYPQDNFDDNDKSFNELNDGNKKKSKTPKQRKKKQTINETLNESQSNNTNSITILKLLNNEDENSSTLDAAIDDSSNSSKPKIKKTPGKRKSLAKLMKKTKKRKRNSSDEEEDPDSDEYEAPIKQTKSKKQQQQQENLNETNVNTTTVNQNEQTCDQIDPSLLADMGRRSTRTIRKTKYTDEDPNLKEEDLLMPLTEAELAEQNKAANQQTNSLLLTQDELIVDKILGMRLFKRKTMRKKEKIKKQPKVEVKDEEKVEVKVEEKEEPKQEDKVEPKQEEESILKDVKEETKDYSKIDIVKETETKVEETTTTSTTNIISTTTATKVESESEESEYEEDGGEIEVEEFYIKYKNISYMHCEWKSRDELYEIDKRIDQKIKRYKQKKSQQSDFWNGEDESNYYNTDYDELFNPDYTEVDRVLDVLDVEETPESKLRYYLIKWKSLPYDESTWESEKDIKSPAKIELFYKYHKQPENNEFIPRPKSDKWNQITDARTYKNGNKLREYQLEGINWLTFCWLNRRNCILADEMGLGKTVQSVTFLHEMSLYGINGPFLVLVPLSTIGNWLREFELWTNFNAIVYHGSSQSRQLLKDYEFYYKPNGTLPTESNSTVDLSSKDKNIKFNALVTTYEVLMSDVVLFSEIKWRCIIIDEAHRLKNKNCRLIEMLKYVSIEHKVLLTGTPLQNNVEELFSLLNYLDEDTYSSISEFMQEFGDLKTDTQVNKLQAILKPIMLRRLKEDVEKNLAPKEETIIEVELTNTQKKYYRAILEKNFEFLYKGVKSNSNMPNLINTMMELRKCCNHPYLINGAEDQIVQEYLDEQKVEKKENHSLKAMIQSCGKLVLVDKLLPKLKANGNRVLIFSQMIRILDILEDYLVQMKYTYERLDGRIRGEARQEAIDRYSRKDSDKFVFLLCTRAGGLGINLTAADTVIIYDSDWNPQNDLQAQARVHRIGQKKSVKIYRLITRNTYEREMFDKASLKLGLDKAVLQSMRNQQHEAQNQVQNQVQNQAQLSKKEIEDLLKKGAYGALMEDDKAGDKFCEEDIDKILQHRSTTIQIDGGTSNNNSNEKSTFSKASFQTSETNTDISIDDPEFWQKWAQKAQIDINEKLNPKDERIIYEPRKRVQTKRFIGGLDELEKENYSDLSSSSDDENGNNQQQNGKRGPKSKNKKEKEEYSKLDGKWLRDECIKIEKSLLVFGWSQWTKILEQSELLKKKATKTNIRCEQDVETLSRCILAFILRNLQSVDEQIKQHIITLIDPSKSEFNQLKTGKISPNVKHNRFGKKKESIEDEVNSIMNCILDKISNEFSLEYAQQCDELLDENYKKHLLRHSNKILQRLKLLDYIRQEIIGIENAKLIDSNESEDKIVIKYLDDQNDDIHSVDWWSKQCDKSLLIGVYKHGFDKYFNMRLDANLCFLDICGPPDPKDLLMEQEINSDDDESNAASIANDTKNKRKSKRTKHKFPLANELNNRIKKLINSHQKLKKQEQIQLKKEQERLERLKNKQEEKALIKQKWSKREEQSFAKTVYLFGIDTQNWSHFRELSQLDKKLDETFNDYYKLFNKMLIKPESVSGQIEVLSEDKAFKCLQRIEFFNKIRQNVLKSTKLTKWMNRCQPSNDLPDWWSLGKHDLDLCKAVAKYGLHKTELYYINDTEFEFKKYILKYCNHIENLMHKDNTMKTDDPIQYYVQNQYKIKQSFNRINIIRDVLNEILIDIEIKPNEPVNYFTNNTQLPIMLWLKERVILQRLENIIHMFENNGEWPKQVNIQQQQQQHSDNESEPGEIKSKQQVIQPTNKRKSLNDDKTALANLFLASGLDLNDRITVINIDNGQRLTGNKAPRRGDLPQWLIKHPNYLPDESEILKLTSFQQQQQQQNELPEYPDKLIMFNKQTNKKLTNDRLTSWKMLCTFLEKNQSIFIDSSCYDLIKTKFLNKTMPDIIKSRLINLPKQTNKSNTQQSNKVIASSSESSSRSSTPQPTTTNKSKISIKEPIKPNIDRETPIEQPDLDLSNPLIANLLAAMNQQAGNTSTAANNPFLSMDFLKELGSQIPGFDMNTILGTQQSPSTIKESSNRKQTINQSNGNNHHNSKGSNSKTPNNHKSTPISTNNNNNNGKRPRVDSTPTTITNTKRARVEQQPKDIEQNPLVDQAKLIQDIMSLTQMNPAMASVNPFLFGSNLNLLQSNLLMNNNGNNVTNKSSRSSSPSNENGSVSPSSSISSIQQQSNVDYSLLMSNLMNLQMMNGLAAAAVAPPPPSPFVSPFLQNDLLTSLLASQNMNLGMDPNMLSMLAMMNQSTQEDISKPEQHKSKHNNTPSATTTTTTTPRTSTRNSTSSSKNTPIQNGNSTKINHNSSKTNTPVNTSKSINNTSKHVNNSKSVGKSNDNHNTRSNSNKGLDLTTSSNRRK